MISCPIKRDALYIVLVLFLITHISIYFITLYFLLIKLDVYHIEFLDILSVKINKALFHLLSHSTMSHRENVVVFSLTNAIYYISG